MYYYEFKKELDELWGEIALLKSNRKYYLKQLFQDVMIFLKEKVTKRK